MIFIFLFGVDACDFSGDSGETDEVAGNGSPCRNTDADMIAWRIKNVCSLCTSSWQSVRQGSCQRPCLPHVQFIRADPADCIDHCSQPMCPLQIISDCGSCVDGQTCTSAPPYCGPCVCCGPDTHAPCGEQ